jgi:hypothetical protein
MSILTVFGRKRDQAYNVPRPFALYSETVLPMAVTATETGFEPGT